MAMAMAMVPFEVDINLGEDEEVNEWVAR